MNMHHGVPRYTVTVSLTCPETKSATLLFTAMRLGFLSRVWHVRRDSWQDWSVLLLHPEVSAPMISGLRQGETALLPGLYSAFDLVELGWNAELPLSPPRNDRSLV
jgi:hypothetical protein